MDGNTLDQMADEVSQARRAAELAASVGIEGGDFAGSASPANHGSGSAAVAAPSVDAEAAAPQSAPPQPSAPVIPALVGLDLAAGVLVTSIGNFELLPSDRNRINKSCLHSLKKGFGAIYSQFVVSSTPKKKRGPKPGTRRKAAAKPKRKYTRRKKSKNGQAPTE